MAYQTKQQLQDQICQLQQQIETLQGKANPFILIWAGASILIQNSIEAVRQFYLAGKETRQFCISFFSL